MRRARGRGVTGPKKEKPGERVSDGTTDVWRRAKTLTSTGHRRAPSTASAGIGSPSLKLQRMTMSTSSTSSAPSGRSSARHAATAAARAGAYWRWRYCCWIRYRPGRAAPLSDREAAEGLWNHCEVNGKGVRGGVSLGLIGRSGRGVRTPARAGLTFGWSILAE